MEGIRDGRFVVVGGATGIGAATVRRLCAEGANVVAGDINAEGLRKTVDSIQSTGGKINGLTCDLASEQSIVAFFKQAGELLGGIDGLANIAADTRLATSGLDKDIDEMSVEVWQRTLNVNLTGNAVAIREVFPFLKEAGAGAIVNISSTSGFTNDIVPAYAASKLAMHSVTRSVARSGGPFGIRCNVVVPGPIQSEMFLSGMTEEYRKLLMAKLCLPYLGDPADLANMVVFLLSREARFVTGQYIAVDGGLLNQ